MESIILILAAVGGSSGLAAIIGQFVTHRANKARDVAEGRSIATEEIEKAIPGMGEIIKQWQAIVNQLQIENVSLRLEVANFRIEVDRLRVELRVIQNGRPHT